MTLLLSTFQGESKVGGQKHFYLETQCIIAVPLKEDDEMDIFASSQHPTEMQVYKIVLKLFLYAI